VVCRLESLPFKQTQNKLKTCDNMRNKLVEQHANYWQKCKL
jgi:hypothetical protein